MVPSMAHPEALEQIAEFEEHMLEIGRSRNTIKAYTGDLTDFAEYTRTPLWPVPSNLDANVRNWLAHRRAQGDAVVTLRRRLFAVKSYYHFAGIPHMLTSIVAPKNQWYVPKVLATPEVDRLMVELSQTDPEAYLFYRLVLLSGFRFNELYNIELTEENLKSKRVTVKDDKDQTRELILGDQSVYLFEEFLQQGGKWRQPKSRFMKALQVCGVISGVKKATSHILRATCAARMLASGLPKEFVKANMGYKATTTIDMIYKVSRRDLTDDYQF